MVQFSGIGTYLRSFLTGLTASADLQTVLMGKISDLPDGPWEKVSLSAPIYSLREQWEVPWAFAGARGSLLHVPHYNVPVSIARRTIATVHDAIHLRFPHWVRNPLARLYAKFFFSAVLPRTAALLTVSEWSKKDIVALSGVSPNHVKVVYPAVSPHYKPIAKVEHNRIKHELGLPDRYLLYVGNLKESKNVPRLIRSYQRLKAQWRDVPPLVLVGKNFLAEGDACLSQPGVLWRGEIPHSQLHSYYACAEGLLFPSLYEGFGLPPVEAMACGVPVLVSDRASLPEVTGGAALIVDPLNEDAISHGIQRLCEESALRNDLITKGLVRAHYFSVSRMVDGITNLYHETLRDKLKAL